MHPIMWASGRITRAVKSTQSAGACSCTEAVGAMNWARAVMAEIFDPTFDARRYDECARRRAGVVVKDCRSLWGCLTVEPDNITSRRLSLEAALLRQECQSCEIKWAKSGQQQADVLTKDTESECTR